MKKCQLQAGHRPKSLAAAAPTFLGFTRTNRVAIVVVFATVPAVLGWFLPTLVHRVPDDVQELRREVATLGVVVRDEGERQYRRLVPPAQR